MKLVRDIIAYQTKGEKPIIENGVVKVKIKGDYIELGTLTDIAALTEELFGDDIPNGVEYMTLGGMIFITYYGRLQACGDGSQLKSSRAVDLFKTFNAALNFQAGTDRPLLEEL